jgi:hypothetical protein
MSPYPPVGSKPESPKLTSLKNIDKTSVVSEALTTIYLNLQNSSSSYPFTNLGQGGPFRSQLSYRLGVS